MSQAATIYTDAELTNMAACAANLRTEGEMLAAAHPFTEPTEQEFYRGTFRYCDMAHHYLNAAALVASCVAAPESTNHLIRVRGELAKAAAKLSGDGLAITNARRAYLRALKALGCQA